MTALITDIQTYDVRYTGLDGKDLIAAMAKTFGDRFAVVSSFGTESAVLLHLTARVDPNIRVIFLDTGKLFDETLQYHNTLVNRLALTSVHVVRPEQKDLSDKDLNGDLWRRNGNQCCLVRKVRPLAKALLDVDAWATGRKVYQGNTRALLSPVENDGPRLKVNPLAYWSSERVAAYFDRYNLPRHPLLREGYESVGCQPCTTPTQDHDAARAGRWRDDEKTECGIHLPGLIDAAATAR